MFPNQTKRLRFKHKEVCNEYEPQAILLIKEKGHSISLMMVKSEKTRLTVILA